jgi:hypothetical protein
VHNLFSLSFRCFQVELKAPIPDAGSRRRARPLAKLRDRAKLEEEAGNSHAAFVAAQPGGRWAWRQGDADECLLSTA